ncbi:rhamnulokinase [Mammaliicoccus sciuri]|uniref:rhamnulokinase n=1 Tax=Mammaliicoccus sciuri TaxID=1296 RepID=UPI000BBE716C|nr:rhamnulokinase family protein [Mammaliicoccus sciuri]PCM41066.1 rhamnulokinase [Mammaliicoccus sciuri]UXU78109.1 rhamnulokinase [Mammaliicoccus sciuri]
MNTTFHVAFDLGASSGRLILGTFKDQKIELEEIYRFANTPVQLNGVLYWDFPKLYKEMTYGLKLLSQRSLNIESLSIDTWGVDFGYLDKHGQLITLPKNYRNKTKLDYENELYEKLSKDNYFNETGISPTSLNSLLQIYEDIQRNPWLIEAVDTVLFMPDLFNYFFTGTKNTNFSIASTSGLLDLKQQFSTKILNKLNIPRSWFTKNIVYYEVIGTLTEEVQELTNLNDVKVISSASHDTSASLITVQESNAFLSCGTWSILGVVTDEPVISQRVYTSGLTNEGTMNGKTKLLKNINALWILQELQRHWSEQGNMFSFEQLTSMAKNSIYKETIDIDDECFMQTGNMENIINDYLKKRELPLPQSVGDFSRLVLESISEKYKNVLENLELSTNKHFTKIHMVGGGIQNELLCQLTAEKTKKQVLTGPIEASSFGNILGQLIALNRITTKDIPNILEKSTTLKIYQ